MHAAPRLPPDGQDAVATMDARTFVPDGFYLTSREFTVDRATTYEPHAHGEHELLWCDSGMARLHADGRSWAIPPSLGVFIPAGVEHSAWAMAGAHLRTTYLDPGMATDADLPTDVTGVVVTDAVRSLLIHNDVALIAPDARLRVQRVVLDLLAPLPRQSFDLSMPHSADLREIAAAILADPADRRTTEDWAVISGMHARTLARRFLAETGESFTSWRILARMQLAIRELSHGRPVLTVARLAGYRSPSAFIGHFRGLTGQTPADFQRLSREDADTMSA